jgi:Domain of unknown function (DUF4262)
MVTVRGDLPPLIRNHGWAVIRVEPQGEEPGYAYTIGLMQTYEHPEVIVFGLPLETMHDILNEIGTQVGAERRFAPGEMASGIIEGFDVAFRAVAPGARSAYMGLGIDYYGRDFPALHCLWPDRDGRFPWDLGASADFRRLQPMLSDGPEPSITTRPA